MFRIVNAEFRMCICVPTANSFYFLQALLQMLLRLHFVVNFLKPNYFGEPNTGYEAEMESIRRNSNSQSVIQKPGTGPPLFGRATEGRMLLGGGGESAHHGDHKL